MNNNSEINELVIKLDNYIHGKQTACNQKENQRA